MEEKRNFDYTRYFDDIRPPGKARKAIAYCGAKMKRYDGISGDGYGMREKCSDSGVVGGG